MASIPGPTMRHHFSALQALRKARDVTASALFGALLSGGINSVLGLPIDYARVIGAAVFGVLALWFLSRGSRE